MTPFEAVYAAPAEELEQQEMLGPGYGGECEGGARVVRGKLVRLFNPIGHFSFAAPPGACDAGGSAGGQGEAWRDVEEKTAERQTDRQQIGRQD